MSTVEALKMHSLVRRSMLYFKCIEYVKGGQIINKRVGQISEFHFQT